MPTDTRVVPANSPDSILLAAEILNAGGLVAFPTDTVYGVAAHGLQPDAIGRLYQAKQRSYSNPIALLVAEAGDLRRVARDVPDSAWLLAQRFWPGALTLIVPRADDLPAILTAGGDSVAVRMADHPIALSVIEAAGAPLATTSANLSGRPDSITAGDVLRDLAGRIDLVLDGGPCPGSVPSTVLDLTTKPAMIRREGPIDRKTLREAMDGVII